MWFFTLAHELVPLALQNKKVIYDLLFRTSAETLLEMHVIQNTRRGDRLLQLLHTWNQTPTSPHVHCVVAGGGRHSTTPLSAHTTVLSSRQVLAFFRGKLFAALQRASRGHWISTEVCNRSSAEDFSSWLRRYFEKIGGLFETPLRWHQIVLQYLGRYTIAWPSPATAWFPFADGKSLSVGSDSAHHNEHKFAHPIAGMNSCVASCATPRKFRAIRHFGFLAIAGVPRPCTCFHARSAHNHSRQEASIAC